MKILQYQQILTIKTFTSLTLTLVGTSMKTTTFGQNAIKT